MKNTLTMEKITSFDVFDKLTEFWREIRLIPYDEFYNLGCDLNFEIYIGFVNTVPMAYVVIKDRELFRVEIKESFMSNVYIIKILKFINTRVREKVRSVYMGRYTELYFNSELRKDTPKDVLDLLQYMLGHLEYGDKLITPKHTLFKTSRWQFMLWSDSYYFDADTSSTLRFDTIRGSYYLCIQCNLKNYDDEIEKFLDWIKPYIEKDLKDFVGFTRYEESEVPTLIYYGESSLEPHSLLKCIVL